MKKYLEEALEVSGGGGDRQRDYGSPLINHLRIAVRWNILMMAQLTRPITPDQVALAMVDLKLARQQQTHKRDNFIDMAGYINCIDSMNQDMVELGYEEGIAAFKEFTFSELIDLLDEMEHADETTVEEKPGLSQVVEKYLKDIPVYPADFQFKNIKIPTWDWNHNRAILSTAEFMDLLDNAIETEKRVSDYASVFGKFPNTNKSTKTDVDK